MDKKTLRNEIKDLSYRWKFHSEQADFHREVAEKTLKMVKRHEGQLVDMQVTEKPKLRHTDFGWDVDGQPCGAVAVGNDLDLRVCGNDALGTGICGEKRDYGPVTVAFNAIDELAALQEDVEVNEEYEFSCDSGDGDSLRLLLTRDGTVHFRGGAFTKNIKPIILCLRRMEATLRRKNA